MNAIEFLNNMRIGQWYWSDFTRNLKGKYPSKEEYQKRLREYIVWELYERFENISEEAYKKIDEMIEWDWKEWCGENWYWRSKSEESFNYLLD